jgi:hypothetical protein
MCITSQRRFAGRFIGYGIAMAMDNYRDIVALFDGPEMDPGPNSKLLWSLCSVLLAEDVMELTGCSPYLISSWRYYRR